MCAPIPKNKWSWKFDKCVRCGKSEKRGRHIHKGGGLCLSCWDKKRSLNPIRKAYSYVNRKKYQEKFKKLPNYKNIVNEKMRLWQQENPLKHKAAWKRRNLRKRFKKFILGKLRIDKNTKNGLIYFCDDCNNYIKTPIKEMEEGKQSTQLGRFQKVHQEIIHKNASN